MTTMSSWGDAGEILAELGVTEDPTYYRGFTAPDEKAVLTVAMAVQEAWIRNDAALFGRIFTGDGSLLMGDRQLTSNTEIREFMAAGFAGPLKGARVKGGPLSVTFLGDAAAMIITEGGIIPPGATAVPREREIRATWIVGKQADGRPRLVSHQGSPVHG